MSSLSYYQYTTGGPGATTLGSTLHFKRMSASTRHLDRGGRSLISTVLLVLGQADQRRAVQPFDRAIRLLDDRDRSPFVRLFGGRASGRTDFRDEMLDELPQLIRREPARGVQDVL